MEDEEGYMALKPRQKQRKPGCRPTAPGAQGSPQYRRWIWVALGLAGAGCLVLLVAVIALAVWGGAGCKLCPTDWLLRGDKCYWLSEERKDWAWSQNDCSGKSSRLLVLQSQEEMDSVQNVTQGENFIWIGLKATPRGGNWTWVDGSRLDPARFPVLGPADGNSCGWIKGSRIHSETCGAELKWICQKDAAVI